MKLKNLDIKKVILFSSAFLSGLILVFIWSLASPPGGSPDEPTHLITIFCIAEEDNQTCQNPTPEKVDLKPVKEISSCYLFQRDRGTGCEVSNLFSTLGPGADTSFYKYSDNAYYKLMSIFASDLYVLSLITMRIINGLIFIFIFFASLYLLPKKFKEAFTLSTIAVSVPLGIYLVTSINTSAWMIIGAIGSWSALYALFNSFGDYNINLKLTIARIMLYLISSFLIVSSRSDGFYFFAIILFTILILFLAPRIEKNLNKFFSRTVSIVIIWISLLIGLVGIFFLLQDRARVTFVDDNFIFLDRLFQNIAKLPHLLLGPFGTWGLGWLDVWLSPITYISIILVVLGLSFYSLSYLDLQHGLALSILSISVITLPLIILQTSGYLVGEWVQPRYILPLYYPLVGLLLFSVAGKASFSRAHYVFIFFLVSIGHSFALFSNLERYIRGQNTYSYNLTTGLEWWWDQVPSPNFFWLLGTLSFFVFFASTLRLSKISN
jgi:hypothetical protein